ncbi:hypothetical protein PYW07_008702 [Mythimna separata]|uniref:Uncharacterized protein n=1 Tax=Mythimna separata TaxID=271217 RepID=A0AAD7YD90_MYTSE|nr:hypothetical protein PYW07_008702 [Mythimna separata]
MNGKGFETICVIVLLNCNILAVVGEDDEPNEEAQPNYEYVQIFRSIPALFEYLLDALEERPEILEKNDVTMFKRNMDIADTKTDECENSDSETKMDKRDCYGTNMQDNLGGSNEVYKREASTSKEVAETTVAYEYGNSNVVMKGLDDIIESTNFVAKRFANTNNKRMNSELLKRDNRVNFKKRSVLSKLDDDMNNMLWKYGDVFLGFEHLFGLDLNPEEIEERILTAEKLLEEHNNKKEEK